MRIYLDLCCLKRPYDDQSQPRILFESQAVLSLLELELASINFVRSEALLFENSLNPNASRAAKVERWLRGGKIFKVDSAMVRARVSELNALGIGDFDAVHVASAELANADRFVTVDDPLLKALRRHASRLRVPGYSLAECLKEIV